MAALDKWDSFYIIIGAAAGVLIGLQFVVITLIAQNPPPRGSQAGAAFATPTVVHFSIVLFLSALMRAPWNTLAFPSAICGITGLFGVAYICVITWRMTTQKSYDPDFEDWLFHSGVPLLSYAALGAAGFAMLPHTQMALFTTGSVTLVLLFCGIHNAWDAVTYHTFVHTYHRDKNDSG